MSERNRFRITNEMRDGFIADCIAVTKRQDYIVRNQDLRDAYQEWLHRFAGRQNSNLGHPEARSLYIRIKTTFGGIAKEVEGRGMHTGMILLPLPTE